MGLLFLLFLMLAGGDDDGAARPFVPPPSPPGPDRCFEMEFGRAKWYFTRAELVAAAQVYTVPGSIAEDPDFWETIDDLVVGGYMIRALPDDTLIQVTRVECRVSG